jgi:hypothetical protein
VVEARKIKQIVAEKVENSVTVDFEDKTTKPEKFLVHKPQTPSPRALSWLSLGLPPHHLETYKPTGLSTVPMCLVSMLLVTAVPLIE